MRPEIKTGLKYGCILFASGFVMGTIRVLFVAPRIGEVGGVLIEVPIMLSLAWYVAGRLITTGQVRRSWHKLFSMGTCGFILLMIFEFVFSYFVFKRPALEFIETFTRLPGAIGLVGQVAAGLMPLAYRKQA